MSTLETRHEPMLSQGPFRIRKVQITGRRYRVVVLDMRRPVGDRQVWWAKAEGWTRQHRWEAYRWIAAHHDTPEQVDRLVRGA